MASDKGCGDGMRTFSEYVRLRENAVQNLQANVGEAVKQKILQILQQPQYAQLKAAFDRLQQAPQLYQAFIQEVAQLSKNTYNLSPAQYIQLIQKHALKAAGAKLPPPIQAAQQQQPVTSQYTQQPVPAFGQQQPAIQGG
jgi:hypothetical protein